MHFRPLFWPTAFTIPAIIILLLRGSWQLSRLGDKTTLLAQFDERSKAPALSLDALSATPSAHQFQRVQLQGSYLHDSEIYLTGRTYEGNAGFHVVTPFVIASSDGGENNSNVVLINRGWVSEAYRPRETREFSLFKGEIDLIGILRMPGRKGYFVPENEPDRGFWFTLKPDEIAAHLGRDDIEVSYYVDLIRRSEKITLPIAAEVNIDVRNSHFNYALTWFGLAIALFGVYLAYHHEQGRFTRKTGE